MDILYFENKREQIHQSLESNDSNFQKLHLLSEFVSDLLQTNNEKLIETFLLEFIDDYLIQLDRYEVFGIEPSFTEKILSQIEEIRNTSIISGYNYKLEDLRVRLQEKYSELISLLKDNETTEIIETASFPLLELNEDNEIVRGYLDTITVSISASPKNEFLIIPSDKTIEERLTKQVKESWYLALERAKKYIGKINSNHKVTIQFNNRYGFYTGNSLGVTLSLAFLEEILYFYNSAYVVKPVPNTSFTGSIGRNGIIDAVGSNVKEKVKTVFYSPIDIFALPENDIDAANEELIELKKKYPNRQIELVPVKSIENIFNRRDIIEISKQKLAVRSKNFIKNNYVGVTLAIFFAMILYAATFITWDQNPATIEFEGNYVYVQNKFGKNLWQTKVKYTSGYNRNRFHLNKEIIDINNDGINEVIISGEDLRNTKFENENGRIVCYNNEKEVLWKYIFTDTLNTYKDSFPNSYNSHLVDVAEINNRKILFATAINDPLYACAVYKLDLLTGKRLKGTLWHSGHIYSRSKIDDYNNDGSDELILIGINNGLEISVMFSIDIKKIDGCAPSKKNYLFMNQDIADFNKYILLPKSDVNRYLGERYNNPYSIRVNYLERREKFYFVLDEGNHHALNHLFYFVDENLNEFEVETNDQFQVFRDSLVAKGELSPPYTNTKEYEQQLLSQIRYWNGTEFVIKKKYFGQENR